MKLYVRQGLNDTAQYDIFQATLELSDHRGEKFEIPVMSEYMFDKKFNASNKPLAEYFISQAAMVAAMNGFTLVCEINPVSYK